MLQEKKWPLLEGYSKIAAWSPQKWCSLGLHVGFSFFPQKNTFFYLCYNVFFVTLWWLMEVYFLTKLWSLRKGISTWKPNISWKTIIFLKSISLAPPHFNPAPPNPAPSPLFIPLHPTLIYPWLMKITLPKINLSFLSIYFFSISLFVIFWSLICWRRFCDI